MYVPPYSQAKYPLVKYTDMSSEVREEALDICITAVEKYATDMEKCTQVCVTDASTKPSAMAVSCVGYLTGLLWPSSAAVCSTEVAPAQRPVHSAVCQVEDAGSNSMYPLHTHKS